MSSMFLVKTTTAINTITQVTLYFLFPHRELSAFENWEFNKLMQKHELSSFPIA